MDTMTTFKERALRVINVAFGGKHHVQSLKWKDGSKAGFPFLCTFLVPNQMSTYDYAGLTHLVVACHDECVRGEITGAGPWSLRVTLTHRERKSKNPDCQAHPELEAHVATIRSGEHYQKLFDSMREGD